MRGILSILFAASLLAVPAGRRDRIRVPVWVEESAGEAPAGLARDALTATLDGEPATVGRILGPGSDLMLLLVADVSQNMTLADTAKRSLSERVQQLPGNVAVGLLRAQDGLRVVVDPAVERGPVVGAIQALPVSGKAGLLDSVEAVARIGDTILAKTTVRVAALYVTDSDIRNYQEDFTNPVINQSDYRDMSRRFPDALIRERISKLEAVLSPLQTPVFILHVAYRSDTLNDAYQAGLMRLAAATGGTSSFCRSQAEIPDAIDRMLQEIRRHYSIEVVLPKDVPQTLVLTLESPGRSLSYRSRFSN